MIKTVLSGKTFSLEDNDHKINFNGETLNFTLDTSIQNLNRCECKKTDTFYAIYMRFQKHETSSYCVGSHTALLPQTLLVICI